jgi:hypothetical protein
MSFQTHPRLAAGTPVEKRLLNLDNGVVLIEAMT